MANNKHINYELLNLIGYGLAKYDLSFVKEFGCRTKTSFYQYIVSLGIAERVGVVKNRQDLFDPFFDNKRKGWWQKGDAYIHRKIMIDSLFGDLSCNQYGDMVKMYIQSSFGGTIETKTTSPLIKSRFKHLQKTGREAEIYFMYNYKNIDRFADGVLDDARLLGDGYDFQIRVDGKYFLAEIKGVRKSVGNIRLTENEYNKAVEYKNDHGLVVVSNLIDLPKMTTIFNPTCNLILTEKLVSCIQKTYHSSSISW